ncbi:unnamed protein product [Lactuca virosa]|uniref:LIM zinc-binding domain-containing protein n=1 Tax=Lactuca virosa TaxID=75947 RepID=A0AAU9NNN1_9ASTR|nr:unnamed protein product [Lactuca virosa]CAH1444847.1 unnamed protein product [Lactuca virosa]
MSTEICIVCDETVDPDEEIFVDGVLYHNECFQCSQCDEKLSENDYSSFDGILYCKPHFEQTFEKNGRISRELSLPKPSELRKTSSKLSTIFFKTQAKQAVSKKCNIPTYKKREARPTVSYADDDDDSSPDFLTPTNQIHPFAVGQLDPDTIMNQFMQNPALIGLLDGVPNQSEMESQDFLRNMLDQITRNPEMMRAIGQLGQHMDDNQDLGSMFSAMSEPQCQGGGDSGFDGDLDMSFMVQQMMPFFSQAFYHEDLGLNLLEHHPPIKKELHRRCYSDSASIKGLSVDCQMNLKEVAKKIEDQYPPLEIFSSVIETTVFLNENIQDIYGLADLCSDEELAEEFMKMMRRDVCRRLGKRYDRFKLKS